MYRSQLNEVERSESNISASCLLVILYINCKEKKAINESSLRFAIICLLIWDLKCVFVVLRKKFQCMKD